MMALGGAQNIRAHEEKLLHYAQERLSKLNSIRIFGDAPGKGGIVSFELQERPCARRRHRP